MASQHDLVHLLAGGAGGTVGAVATCPLEVVKTRLQSSLVALGRMYIPPAQIAAVSSVGSLNGVASCSLTTSTLNSLTPVNSGRISLGIFMCLKNIVHTEGMRGLFKGLGPNLVGVAPSRAIYFYAYAMSKQKFNERMIPDTPIVHICSAVAAGFSACTLTNPVWLIKTRLQLDQKKDGNIKCLDCIRNVYRTCGLSGFYKGITASYFGISETVIHFVIYEAVKAKLLEYRHSVDNINARSAGDFVNFMIAGAISKTIATCIAYPHEVARTRLREEGNKYKNFSQTILLVAKEEGYKGLYRGLATQMLRQIPNTAILMSTYELVVYLFSGNEDDDPS